MSVEGEAEMLLNVDNITKGFDKRARVAVKAGAEVFADNLKSATPKSSEDHSGKIPLIQDVQTTNVSVSSGNFVSKVGYGREKGPIAHFPNSGTSKQSPQHFVEETQVNSKDAVLAKFVENLRIE